MDQPDEAVRTAISLLHILILATACAAAARSEPEPVRATTSPPAAGSPDTDARVRFMRDMIVHHRQALEMAALVPERAGRQEVRRLAQRIEAAQKDEIARMQRWLEAHDEAMSDTHAHHGGHADMPGMLSAEEMSALADASGAEFDRRFLAGMIRHHEGALVMVESLLATDAARQDIEVFQLASQIDADQRAEITRMRRLLEQRGG